MNARSEETGRVYRLPTEAEWEYACRSGTTTRYYFGDDSADLGDYAWYRGNTEGMGEGRTHRVGEKRPNAWGLYDMHGNVLEWCSDWYGSDYYANSPLEDPTGPESGSQRVARGGRWRSTAKFCRSAPRNRLSPRNRWSERLGFRLAFSSVD